MPESHIVVITGLSGSGKTLAADAFEDQGYFCVDNLPVSLMQPFAELIERGAEPVQRAAIVVDARERDHLAHFPETFRGLRGRKTRTELLFFECSDDVLKRRFSESRRPHPLARDGSGLEEAIARERAALAPLREMADRIIDTSRFTSHELRAFLRDAYGETGARDVPNVNVLSFGFKRGLPTEADLVFDVRFLPNPHFEPELRTLDGRTGEIQAYLDRSPLTGEFLERMKAFVEFLIPHYGNEGKTYLTIAIGCTGGKHRSVALAERLGTYLRGQGTPASVRHRDLGQE